MTRAGIIGLGLIGGSIAKALKAKAGFTVVKAYDSNASSLSDAKKDNVIDEYSTTELSIFSDCDIVFICAPIPAIPTYIEKLSTVVKDGCIVTDAGSTKKSVVEKANQFENMQFIGGHPMAGSEKAGYEASHEFLFENAFYVIVPSKHASDQSVSSFKKILSEMLTIPIVLGADEHDKVMAAISHMPHLIASALVNTVRRVDDQNDTFKSLAAGGFRDITRIASSDSRLWQSIVIDNRAEILNALDTFTGELDEIKGYLRTADETELGGYMRLAKSCRDNMPASSRAKYIKSYELYTDIEDKPGSIAIVSTLLGVNGVNIKNIGINNNREQQDGVLQITFGTEADMKKGAEVLKSMHFKIYNND